MSPIKVAYFVAEYHRFTGSQRQLLTLLQNLPKSQVEALVVFPGEGACVEAYRAAGISVKVLPAPPVLNRFGKALLKTSFLDKAYLFVTGLLPYSLRVLRLMRESEAAILHCNSGRGLILAGLAPRLAGYPVLWHVRGQTEVLGRLLRWYCETLSSRIVLNAQILGVMLSARGRGEATTVYDGVDATRWLQQAQENIEHLPEELLEPRCPLILTVASLTPFKGYHYLIEAARSVTAHCSDNPPLFVALGTPNKSSEIDKQYVHYLDQLIQRYGLTNWHFLGWQPNPFPYYRAADIIVLPSVEQDVLMLDGNRVEVRGNEGFPTTVLEAMCLGKPVIATQNAGIPEQVVNGETGLLVPQRDSQALAQAMLYLLDKPSVRKSMGERAATRVQALFTIERMVEQMINLYHGLSRHGQRDFGERFLVSKV